MTHQSTRNNKYIYKNIYMIKCNPWNVLYIICLPVFISEAFLSSLSVYSPLENIQLTFRYNKITGNASDSSLNVVGTFYHTVDFLYNNLLLCFVERLIIDNNSIVFTLDIIHMPLNWDIIFLYDDISPIHAKSKVVAINTSVSWSSPNCIPYKLVYEWKKQYNK